MRAKTQGKHAIRKRFAILIGVAAVGVMALGAQTGAQTQTPTPPGQAPPTCNGLAATIVGTEGPDDLVGTRGRDVIVALGGNDLNVKGRAGNDVICGGAGDDLLIGRNGNDTLLGQAGSDLLNGDGVGVCGVPQHGKDEGRCEGGTDRCEGGKGIDYTTPLPGQGRKRSDCEIEKSIEKSGFVPGKFH